MMRTGIIYGYTNLESGKMYIGQTLHPERRFNAHRHGKYSNGWHKDYQNNPDKYEYSVIEYNVPEDKLDEREIFWISFFDSYRNGYNLTEGGGGSRGFNVSISTREKLSKIHKGKPKTLEQRQKMSEAQKGTSKTLEQRQKMSERMKGEHHRDVSGENNPFYGKKHSEETCKKMSEHHRDVSGEKNPMYGKRGDLSPMYGRKWYNNGIVQVMSLECPIGFIKGMLKK